MNSGTSKCITSSEPFFLSPLRMYNQKHPSPPPRPPTQKVLTGEEEDGGEQREHDDSSPGHLDRERATREPYWT